MARPLRLEFAGAVYHVTSRGGRREDIYLDDGRQEWMAALSLVCKRFNWVVHAFCQMTNHYHLLVETADGKVRCRSIVSACSRRPKRCPCSWRRH
ncbi:MAG TPA: transposase [Burkholderiaceae bacterium]|nr:transposase [Burkholderiaceae bacterium]